MKINTIVFDMGGVLLDFGAELFSRRLHVGAEGEALLRQHLLCTTDWVRLDRGTITEEEVYAHACARLPAELHAAAEYIIYHWNEPIVPITGTADVVRELKARGYTLYLLSNAARRPAHLLARHSGQRVLFRHADLGGRSPAQARGRHLSGAIRQI